jgi:two-component system response regulator AtoC
VFSLSVPPLRERLEDVPLLVEHFIRKHGERMGRRGVVPSPEALKALVHYSWPGNVRELENAIERGLVLCDDTLDLSSLPETVRRSLGPERRRVPRLDSLSIKAGAEQLERELIRRALEQTGGNRTHAARLLEISHRALLYKLKEYGIE